MKYALILVLASVVVIVILALVGPAISDVFCEVLIKLGGTCNSGGGEETAEESGDDEVGQGGSEEATEPDCSAEEAALAATNDAYQACGGLKSKCPNEWNAGAVAFQAWVACKEQ